MLVKLIEIVFFILFLLNVAAVIYFFIKRRILKGSMYDRTANGSFASNMQNSYPSKTVSLIETVLENEEDNELTQKLYQFEEQPEVFTATDNDRTEYLYQESDETVFMPRQ